MYFTLINPNFSLENKRIIEKFSILDHNSVFIAEVFVKFEKES